MLPFLALLGKVAMETAASVAAKKAMDAASGQNSGFSSTSPGSVPQLQTPEDPWAKFEQLLRSSKKGGM